MRRLTQKACLKHCCVRASLQMMFTGQITFQYKQPCFLLQRCESGGDGGDGSCKWWWFGGGGIMAWLGGQKVGWVKQRTKPRRGQCERASDSWCAIHLGEREQMGWGLFLKLVFVYVVIQFAVSQQSTRRRLDLVKEFLQDKTTRRECFTSNVAFLHKSVYKNLQSQLRCNNFNTQFCPAKMF